MDINAQIKILEALLKQPDNRECADCNSKTPRWASITFGAFVCLRCSGQHRQLQVHISKIKSVNLDKWAPEMVEMYKHVNNAILNTYWEARLPQGYNKPSQNANSADVASFIRDKYVNKKWIDTSMTADPATLYWKDRKKFDKFIKRVTAEAGGDAGEESDDSETRRQKRRERRQKRKEAKESDDDEVPQPIVTKIQASLPTKPTKPVLMGDLINLEAMPASTPSGNHQQANLLEGFSDFQDADPMKSTDDFADFQQASNNSQNSNPLLTQNGINIQGLMNMYNQNSSQFPGQGTAANHTAPINKYSALDAFSNQYTPQPQTYSQMGGAFQMNSFGASPGGYGMQQPRTQNPISDFQGQHPMMGQMGVHQQPAQQTNMFTGMNMTINVNQYGQVPTQQIPQFNPFMMAGQIPSGGMNSCYNKSPQMPQPQLSGPSFMQPQKPQIAPSQGSHYGGLVNLTNLGSSSSQPSMNNGFGQGVGLMAGGSTGQQKKDAFSGLLSGQWKA